MGSHLLGGVLGSLEDFEGTGVGLRYTSLVSCHHTQG